MHHYGSISFEGNVESDWGADKNWNIMQYIGLKDRNNIEIYDSDILRFSVRNTPNSFPTLLNGIVKWHDKKTKFYISINEKIEYDIWEAETLEVIGNIFENKP